MGDTESFYRMSAFEVAVGWIFGIDESVPVDAGNVDALGAFGRVVQEALRSKGPTYVTFSGGRDSSAVLAVAIDQARTEGLNPPIPVTIRYPGVESAEESEWQERVIRHLEVTDWIKITYSEEDDLLGPSAQQSLRRFGMLWPPTVHLLGPTLAATKGGTVLTGEGGDEMLGNHRITPLTGLLHRNVYPRRSAAVRAVKEMAPRVARRRILRAELAPEACREWLRSEAQLRLLRALVADRLAEPLSWRSNLERLPYRRATRLGIHNMGLVGEAHGVRYVHPFHDPAFGYLWAREGGALGYPGRTVAMKKLFGHLLPDQVLRRSTKARFNDSYVRDPVRTFAREWEGDGVDQRLVVTDALRDEWLSPMPHAGTFALLHAAWLQGDARSSSP